MQPSPMEQLTDAIIARGAQTVHVAIPDVDGGLRERRLPLSSVPEEIEREIEDTHREGNRGHPPRGNRGHPLRGNRGHPLGCQRASGCSGLRLGGCPGLRF